MVDHLRCVSLNLLDANAIGAKGWDYEAHCRWTHVVWIQYSGLLPRRRLLNRQDTQRLTVIASFESVLRASGKTNPLEVTREEFRELLAGESLPSEPSRSENGNHEDRDGGIER